MNRYPVFDYDGLMLRSDFYYRHNLTYYKNEEGILTLIDLSINKKSVEPYDIPPPSINRLIHHIISNHHHLLSQTLIEKIIIQCNYTINELFDGRTFLDLFSINKLTGNYQTVRQMGGLHAGELELNHFEQSWSPIELALEMTAHRDEDDVDLLDKLYDFCSYIKEKEAQLFICRWDKIIERKSSTNCLLPAFIRHNHKFLVDLLQLDQYNEQIYLEQSSYKLTPKYFTLPSIYGLPIGQKVFFLLDEDDTDSDDQLQIQQLEVISMETADYGDKYYYRLLENNQSIEEVDDLAFILTKAAK